ncbi:hypothetical protein ACHAXT_009561 [Thalassiosira profunda]
MAAATTRRRKIFPHRDEAAPLDASEGASAAGSDAPSDDGYDNAKSKKVHPSARGKSGGRGGGASPDEGAGSAAHHLLPLPLVVTVLVCSGLFWVASFRDVMATGKPILDRLGALWGQEDADANYLPLQNNELQRGPQQYTKSTQWFDDSKGWKSKQGGLSTILAVTTDANDMGGLYVRKMAGVAGMAYHAAKLLPIVFQNTPQYDAMAKNGRWTGASWSAGHYDPLLALGMIGDVCVTLFYLARVDDLKNAGATGVVMALILASFVEALVLGLYLLNRRMKSKPAKVTKRTSAAGGGYDPAEDPNSLPSRIVARTVLIVSSLMALVSLRDLLLPGTILSFIPRDDIYLEWTGAFLHSPPPDTVEADEQGLEAPLFAGDKFVSQLLGLYLSLCCLFKFMSAWGWSKGNRSMGTVQSVDRSGVVSSKMMWKAHALGDAMMLGMLRLFTPAAKTASLDLRWHLMLVAYEAFILFLYGFW